MSSEEPTYKDLIAKRSSIKGRVTKFKNNLEILNSLDSISKFELSKLAIKLPNFEALFTEFDELQCQIEILSGDKQDNELAIRDLIEQDFYHCIALAKSFLDSDVTLPPCPNLPHSSAHSCCHHNDGTHSIGFRLPELKIPNYDGSYFRWLEFKEIFTSLVHDNKNIKNIHKFQYLNSYLTGEASRVISNFEISDHNYTEAWKILCERYDNKRQLINNHLKSLLDVESVRETDKSLRFIIDHVTKNLRALNSLGLPTDKWDALIIFIIAGKLDNNTYLKWEENRNHLPDIPTLEQFFSFLKGRADVLETSFNRSKQDKSKYNHNNQTHKGQTKALVTTSLRENSNSPQTNSSLNCLVCNNKHFLHQCNVFKNKSVEDRINFINSNNLCQNCLRGGHKLQQCNLLGTCKICKKQHNSLLHKEPENKNNESIAMSAISSPEVLLCTAMVQLTNPVTKDTATVRALLDSGSQSTFITEAVRQMLKLSPQSSKTEVVGIGNIPLKTNIQRCSVQLSSKNSSFNVIMSCLILPTISGKVPKVAFNIKHLNLLNFSLADPNFNEPSTLDMLIGADLFWDLVGSEQHSLGPRNPILRSSKLGWLIAGPIYNPKPVKGSKQVMCNFLLNENSSPNLHDELSKFWELENFPQAKALSKEEKLCEQHFLANTTRTHPDGRFCVALPLREDPIVLGDSYGLAKKRLFSLEARFRKQPETKQAYSNFINEYEALGHLTKIKSNDFHRNSFYLPHHPVIKQNSESTRLRVVFDGSAKTTSGISVNDLQMVGPIVQDSLFNILVRFRQHKFVFSADIEKMFRAILVRESDRHLQQILWRENENDPIQVLQLNTVTYGFSSASFLATRCIIEVGEQCSDPTIKTVIKNDLYVDDILTGANTEKEMQFIQQSVSKELANHGFHLRKYRSNLPTSLFADSVDLKHDDLMISNATSTLGVGWTPSSDEFHFNIQYSQPNILTKRSILSSTFKIFDPLGLLSLCTIKPKIIFQDICSLKLDWDQPVPPDIEKSWLKFTEKLSELSSLRIPRCIVINNVSITELHCFTDASQRAFGTTIYLRSFDATGKANVSLVCAKSRVSPIKPTNTIPRLELAAALLGAQLSSTVLQALRCPISRQVYWTDSTVVLGWIRSPNKAKTFVANRVAVINDITDPSWWRHVPTSKNPADIVSRGVSPDQVNSTLWWHGPDFLLQPEDCWPTGPTLVVDLPEMKANPAFIGETTLSSSGKLINIEKYSKLLFLQNVLARILRFIHNIKCASNKELGPLSTEERARAMTHLIKSSQKQSFSKEIDTLSNKKPLKSNVALTSLNPFLDSEGILRVGGRIDTSAHPYDKRHPIVLKSDNHLTKLIFQYEHHRLFHAGPQLLLASVRERFWPIGGRNLARRVCRECLVCRRSRGKTMSQMMGNLPPDRVEPDYPFYTVGTDFAGPFLITDRKGRGCKITKCYMCIFICFRYKCIHLEAVSDLSKDAFLLTLKRFIARRGICKTIYCDNGRNFVAAAKEINSFLTSNKDVIIDSAATQGIEFRFSPAYAPNFGGLFEAGVKSAKYFLHRILKNTHLTYEELSSLFTQIEAILNSRPLCPLSPSPDDFSPLTPGHFIIGRPLTALPSSSLLETNVNRLDRYQRLEQARQHFWKRWSNEYIAELQQRTKWRTQCATLKLDDLVLIKEDGTSPMCWRLGRISKLFPGTDGLPRVADVSTTHGLMRRAINRLCLLPAGEDLH